MTDQTPNPDWVDMLETVGIDPNRKLSEFLEPEICAAIPGLRDSTVREDFPSKAFKMLSNDGMSCPS